MSASFVKHSSRCGPMVQENQALCFGHLLYGVLYSLSPDAAHYFDDSSNSVDQRHKHNKSLCC